MSDDEWTETEAEMLEIQAARKGMTPEEYLHFIMDEHAAGRLDEKVLKSAMDIENEHPLVREAIDQTLLAKLKQGHRS